MTTPSTDKVLERNEDHPDYCGSCEGCGTMIFTGDRAFRYAEGEMACEPCAPTWATTHKEWNEPNAKEMRREYSENYANFTHDYEALIAAGGDSESKYVWVQ